MNRALIRIFPVLLCMLFTAAVMAQSVVRGPYLQQQTENSIMVRWRTDVATDSVVRYGLDGASLGSTAAVSGARTEHSVKLTGLSPVTQYFYSVGDSLATLAGDSSYFFSTAPVTGTPEPTRFWVLGDSGTANADARAVRDAFKAWSASSPADLVIFLGDNAYNDGTDAQYQAAVFDTYPEILRQLPAWPTLGNHDGFSADSATQSGPYYDIFELPTAGEVGGLASGTEAYYSFDYGEIHFISLDSYETDRSRGGNMLQWLEGDLAFNDKPWVIAFWHHPPYSKGAHDSDTEGRLIDMRQNVLPILEAWGVDLVMAGHGDSYERSFLLDGHYGLSTTLDPVANVLNPGDGRESGDGVYEKPGLVAAGNQGAVYAVAGSSGKLTSNPALDHPAMFISLASLGSMVIDVAGNRLDAVFIDQTGLVLDEFTLMKTPDLQAPMIADARVQDGTNTVSLTVTDDGGETAASSAPVTVSLSAGTGTLEVMSWVPVYAIAQSQAAAQADFGACDAVDGLTRVGLQFWTPNDDGTIKYADHEFYTPVDADVNWWKTWAAANGIEVFMTIYNNTGSWDWPLARAAFAGNRATFVAALVAELDRLGLDGIDLDLEGIDGTIIASDRADYDQFVRDLWLETSARGKGLTINSFPYIWNAPNQDWWVDWVGEVDNIHSMGYEQLYEGGTGWQQYSFQQNTGIAAGHDGEVVSMGMPSWTASWGTSSGRGTSAQAHVQEIRYDLAQPTGIAIWDMQLTAWQDSSLWCEISALKSSGSASPPAAPTGLAAAVYSSSRIDLNWSDNSADETGFRVERSPDGSNSWTQIVDLPADSTAYQNTALAAGTTYYYRVFAYNANGNSGNSNTDSATTFTVPRSIQFSGRSWTVKASASPVGPGPNYFSDTADDVWVDANGALHLRIAYSNGNWRSSEVISDDVLGYGTYTFTLGSRVDLLDRNIVVGLFSWDSFAPEFNYREIDIEFARWGNPLTDNSQYVVQPWDNAGNTFRWETLLSGNDSTHAFTWRADRVEFSSHQGSPPGALIQSWTYNGPDVPPAGTTSGNARINFWLNGGSAPFDGQAAELLIKSFDFAPLPVNNPPTAAFTHSCTELDCAFTDTSTDSDGTVTGWSWDFGDGSSSTAQHPSHSYAADGTYTVELTVTDNEGATDLASTPVSVAVTPPFSDNLAIADISGSGTVTGTYTATFTDDGNTQSIRERESGGRKRNRYSFAVHTWQFSLPANAMATLYANAWSSVSGDDNFQFSWSTDNASYFDLLPINSTDPANVASAIIPANVSGTFYIRVRDTDQTAGNRTLDTFYVDQLFIRTDSAGGSPPAAPTALVATVAGSDRINLAWTDNATDEAGFRVQRSGDGVSFSDAGTSPADDTTFTDTGLSAGTTYWYRVLAFNGSGDSLFSNTDSATTDAGPAVSLSLNGYKARGRHVVDLNWSGTTTANVDIYRDGGLYATVADTGAYTDRTGNKGARSYDYQVCEAGTAVCSAVKSVTF